jgi:Gpi18-like mannosyltransferase
MASFLSQHRMLIGALPPILGGVVFLLMMHPRVKVRMTPFFLYVVGASWLVTRVLFYVSIYIFHLIPRAMEQQFVPSDVTCEGGWVYQASRILGGQMPYRDFFSNYSILYSYIISAAYKVWHSPLAFVPLFILFDLGCLFLVYEIAKCRWGMSLARDATLAFTLLPMTWYVTVRHSQDEVMLAFFALLGALAWTKKRDVLAMVLFGIGICCTKFMFGLVVLPFLLVSRHKIRDAAAFGGTLFAINLPFMLAGANVLAPFSNQ